MAFAASGGRREPHRGRDQVAVARRDGSVRQDRRVLKANPDILRDEVDRAFADGLKPCEFGGRDGTAAVAKAILSALYPHCILPMNLPTGKVGRIVVDCGPTPWFARRVAPR